MKTIFRITSILLLFITCTPLAIYSQSLSWASSFSPAWGNGNTNGNASNVDGRGLNVASTVTLSGGSFASSGGNATPTVNGGSPLVAGSASRLNLTPNFSSNTHYISTVISFSRTVSNVSFRIADIDKQNANSNSYYDRVTITGSDGLSTYYPALSKYDATTDPNFLIISGNTAHANTTNGQGGKTNSNASDQRGTINIDFGSAMLSSVTIIIDNAPGAQSNPGTQTVAIGEMSFFQPVLPVKLISFSGSQRNNDVQLKWTTAQEINSESFKVERSYTGSNWETIATIAAAGNTHLQTDYAYTDAAAMNGTLFYRLRQVDIDGSYEYSAVVRIDNKTSLAQMSSYPNPFTSSFNISVHSSIEQSVITTVTDISGRKIFAVVRNLHRGNNNFSLTGLDQLLPGIYIMTLQDEENKLLGQQRLLKK